MSKVKRYAIVKRNWRVPGGGRAYGPEKPRLEALLPANYEVERTLEDAYVIGGVDERDGTLEGRVLPRLASNNIVAREMTPEEIVTWVVAA